MRHFDERSEEKSGISRLRLEMTKAYLSPKKVTVTFLFLLLFSSVLFAESQDFPSADHFAKQLFAGEKLVYHIRYLGVPIGRSEAEVKEITEIGGRKAYHIEVHVRSYPLIDLFYKVRGHHQSWVDVETLHSLRYEKKIREGRVRREEVIEPPPGFQDALSCGYFFRTMDLAPTLTLPLQDEGGGKGRGSSVFIPVFADGKKWQMEVKIFDSAPMEIGGIGRFQALETEPVIEFRGIFVKQGRIRGWVSLDERRIPLKMKVKIPVLGHVTAELAEYHPGENR